MFFIFAEQAATGQLRNTVKKKGIGRLIGQAAYLPSEQAGKLPTEETAC